METPETTTQAVDIDSRARLESAVSELAVLTRDRAKKQAALDAKIAKLRERYVGEIGVLDVEIDIYTESIEEYALEHADELLKGQKTKTLTLPAGELKYSKGRKSVRYVADESDVCAQLHAAGLGDLVVMSERPDKSAIGKLDTPPVKGVEFVEAPLTVKVKTN
jgi:phage host-nuclease inhibitor protein Gam